MPCASDDLAGVFYQLIELACRNAQPLFNVCLGIISLC